MDKRIKVLGVPVDMVDMKKAVEVVEGFLQTQGLKLVFTPNPEMIIAAQKDRELMEALNSADLLVPDGIGLVLMARILGARVPERVAGYDLVCRLFDLGTRRGISFYLLGAEPGVAEAARKNLERDYPGIKIGGTHHGYFDEEEGRVIIQEINRLRPDILLVGLGVPKQEKWLYQNKGILKAKVGIGIGGALNVIAGRTKRAPKVFIKLGLEWFYRLLKEPRRIKRVIQLLLFVLRVMSVRLMHPGKGGIEDA